MLQGEEPILFAGGEGEAGALAIVGACAGIVGTAVTAEGGTGVVVGEGAPVGSAGSGFAATGAAVG